MIKYCVEKWDKNKDKLENELRARSDLNGCTYLDLVKMVVRDILNGDIHEVYSPDMTWDADHVSEINDGDYQGTLLYLIPSNTYQPDESEYLLTYVGYGSCSCCDTLLAIQDYDSKALLTERQVKDFMQLCKDIVCNTIRPYNVGWRASDLFEAVEKSAT